MYVADGMTNHDNGDDFYGIHAFWSLRRKDEWRLSKDLVGEVCVETLLMYRYSAIVHLQDLQK
jgi:hypothetical protein